METQTKQPGGGQTNNQRKKIIGVGIVVVAVVLILIASSQRSQEGFDQNTNTATSTGTVTTSTATSTAPQVAAKTTAQKSIEQALSYEKAVAQYENRRIQFDNVCQATPSRMTFKNGTAIMLDNRTEKTKTIKLSTKAFTLKPLSYITMKVTSKVLPSTIFIDCDNKFNVGQILVQE